MLSGITQVSMTRFTELSFTLTEEVQKVMHAQTKNIIFTLTNYKKDVAMCCACFAGVAL